MRAVTGKRCGINAWTRGTICPGRERKGPVCTGVVIPSVIRSIGSGDRVARPLVGDIDPAIQWGRARIQLDGEGDGRSDGRVHVRGGKRSGGRRGWPGHSDVNDDGG
jgi:hypothetical protein